VLIALSDQQKVDARDAVRGTLYRCLRCGEAVSLRHGRIVGAHFLHCRRRACAWPRGESLTHLLAKYVLRDSLAAHGLRAEVEVELSDLGNSPE
jgi:competence CoiA-like predicted nuclease